MQGCTSALPESACRDGSWLISCRELNISIRDQTSKLLKHLQPQQIERSCSQANSEASRSQEAVRLAQHVSE